MPFEEVKLLPMDRRVEELCCQLQEVYRRMHGEKLSQTLPYHIIPQYRMLMEIGLAIVPYLMNRSKYNSDDYDVSRLWCSLTGVMRVPGDNPWADCEMREWHEGGYALGQDRFRILHDQLSEAKHNGNLYDVEQLERGIRYLGLYSLPAVVAYIIENGVDDCSAQALTYWSEHWTDSKLDATQMTREGLKRWWLGNKEKLLIPGAGAPMLDNVLGITAPESNDSGVQSPTTGNVSSDSPKE
jgi:hypothetical protein